MPTTIRRISTFIGGAVLFLTLCGGALAAEPAKNLEKRLDDLEKETTELKKKLSTLSRFLLPDEVDFCGAEVPIDRWYVREELDRQLLGWISYNRRQIATWVKRSAKFFPFVEKKLEDFGLPGCLKYLMVVESSLLEEVTSSAGAGGLWQFMIETGRRFGLTYGKFVDDRRNFEKSTSAALSYLRDLYLEFQDWPLAMAAYNAGENKVRAEIQRQGFHEYWRLIFLNSKGVPTETNTYIYKIIALNLILENPERYGFFIKPEDLFTVPEIREITIHPRKNVSLLEIARQHNTSFLELKKLNHWIRGETLPPRKEGWTIIVPAH